MSGPGTAWSRAALLLEILVVVAALVTVPVTIAEERGARGTGFLVADWAIWAVFLAEYVVALVLAGDRRRHFRRDGLGLAIVVLSFPALPHLLAFVRLARLTRLVRLSRIARLVLASGRGLHGLRAVLGRRGLLVVVSVATLVVVTGGGLLAVLEPERVEGGGLAAGVWWAVVTASTVGYGDIAPSSLGGRLVALVVILAGIGLVSTLGGSIAAYFVEQDRGADVAELHARLERIESALRRLERDRGGAGGDGGGAPEGT